MREIKFRAWDKLDNFMVYGGNDNYNFELYLKHLIISEMNVRNIEVAAVSNKYKSDLFSVYSEKKLLEILDLGPVGKLIELYLKLFKSSNIKERRHISTFPRAISEVISKYK